ncbi:MAG: ribonuclease [Deltaproteobacteria bacterium]|nr:ribonuclease [Deltaproteobacteria bacterium]
MRSRFVSTLFLLAVAIPLFGHPPELFSAETCEATVKRLNGSIQPRVDEEELVLILRSLNENDNRRLPSKFVTKSRARKMGWKPGEDLWAFEKLRGKSIGGDVFGNRESRLPNGKRIWREADLDYRGGRRGPKRIVYSNDGLRRVTVDHYNTFKEIPPCR